MPGINTRFRKLLGGAIAAGALVLPSTAFADCAKTVDTAAFHGTIPQYYPQKCYTAGLKQLGPDVNTYSPNVARNLKAAQRRDRNRKLKFTIQWLPKHKVRVTSNYKLKAAIELRKGVKLIAKGSISGYTTTLIAKKKVNGALRVAVIWTLAKKKIIVTAPAPQKVIKK